jgi:precorrin-4/cobalt-precorrin-4 C11-methyltransferase
MIYFVGAGPGAIDLITIRGKTLLEQADVVIYAGSLVNPELLNFTKKECAIYNSAKMTLEEVIATMVPAAREGKLVVRLHTGDPSIYGAIREQMDLLDIKGIRYEVVPGVSSFFGAVASLKKEYTLPNVSQTVIITRMEGRTPVPVKEDIALLASHQATMAIFLSTGMLESLSAKLIEGGYTEDTPAAIVFKATWPDEKQVHCTVGTLKKAARENNITKTSLILVGRFLESDYQRSKLYDPAFTHEYRERTKQFNSNIEDLK